MFQFDELDFECVNSFALVLSSFLFKISLKSPCGIEKKQYLCNAFGERHITNRMHIRAFSSAGSEHLPYKQRVGGSNPSTPTYLVILQIHFGRLAQLVQSICLTSRGSGVRIPQRPQIKVIHLFCITFFLYLIMHTTYILHSVKIDTYYIGSTSNIEDRLKRHNSGRNTYTKRGIP